MGSHTVTLNLASTMIFFLQLSRLVTFSGCCLHLENGVGPAQMKMMEGHMPMSPIMFKEGTDCSNCDNCKHCPKCWWCNFFGCGVNENCNSIVKCGNTDFHDGSTGGYDC